MSESRWSGRCLYDMFEPGKKAIMQYVYGYYENMTGTERELQKLQTGDWMERLRTVLEEELYGN